jgi:hypothetical protein
MEREESLKEYTSRVKNEKGKYRPRKFSGSYNGYMMFREMRKDNWKNSHGVKVRKENLRRIMSAVGRIQKEIIATGGNVLLPCHMGRLYIKSQDIRYKYDDEGNVINSTLPVDWNKTFELWYSDESKRKKHITVRKMVKRKFNVVCARGQFHYKNEYYVRFMVCRGLKLRMGKYITDNKLDV